jgi:penicillin-binding protein 1A
MVSNDSGAGRRGRRRLLSADEVRPTTNDTEQDVLGAVHPDDNSNSVDNKDAPSPGEKRAMASTPVASGGTSPRRSAEGAPRRGGRRSLESLAPVDETQDATLRDASEGFDVRATGKPSELGLGAPYLPDTRARRFNWGYLFLAFGACALLLVAVGLGAGYWAVKHYSVGLPSVRALKAGYHPPQITRFHATDKALLASVFTERRTVVDFEVVPNHVKLAFLAAEDATFYEHLGVNYVGIVRAVVANLRAGHKVQGGSTITQQVVKNVLLDSERSYRRKIREALLARRLEASLSKDEIFWLYLNHIYLGHGRYGIEEASRFYFGKHASDLGLDEAAILAGLVASPEHFSPRRDAQKALKRRRYVLDQMLSKGFVTQAVYQAVVAMPLQLGPVEESENRIAPEMVERAKRVLRETVQGDASVGGVSVYTTLKPELQTAARDAVRANLDAYMKRHKLQAPYYAEKVDLWGKPFTGQPQVNRVYAGVVEATDDEASTIAVRVGEVSGRVVLSGETRYNPQRLSPSAFTRVGALLRVLMLESAGDETPALFRLALGPESALVAVDIRTRNVVALVGGYEAGHGLDRATQARRQAGSTFKPLVYSLGLRERLLTPATLIEVPKAGHGVEEGGPLRLSLRNALAHSNNEAAVSVLRRVGPEAAVSWSRKLGISSPIQPDLSLVLGAYEVTPTELLNAYVTFANGGISGDAKFVNQITAPDGSELKLPDLAATEQVLTAEEAYLTTSLLRSVVEVGTGKAALKLGFEVAGKTGTTNDVRDAWFVGYSTDYAAVVWVGNDDSRPLGRSESGAVTALPAWVQFMKEAHRGRPKTRFVRPASLLTIAVDPLTGLLPAADVSETALEEFLPGTEPTQTGPASPESVGEIPASELDPELSQTEANEPSSEEP